MVNYAQHVVDDFIPYIELTIPYIELTIKFTISGVNYSLVDFRNLIFLEHLNN